MVFEHEHFIGEESHIPVHLAEYRIRHGDTANLREHCSWVHLHDREAATKKAKDMVKVGVARARNLEPQIEKTVPVTRAALVIGGGVAGMQASLDLADSGIPVYLVEKDPSIGGIMAALDKTYPTMDCSI